MKSIFFAGAAKEDITPSPGTLINGDFVSHTALDIHDNLYAKAIVMESHGISVALIVVDTCAMRKDFIDEIKLQIFQQASIIPSNILISSTHAHSGGSVEEIFLTATDIQYRLKLRGSIIQSVLNAKRNLRPAKTCFGFVDVPDHVVCRRYYMKEGYVCRSPVTGNFEKVKTNPLGDEHQIEKRVSRTDAGLNFLAIKSLDGKWISLLGNYSMHYVGDYEPGTITSDYFGAFGNKIAMKLNAGDNFIGIMSNGTSGDTNIWDFIQPGRYPQKEFEKTRLIGDELAEKVFQSLKNFSWEKEPVLSAAYDEVAVAVRKPSASELERAKSLIENEDFKNIAVDDKGIYKIYAREQLLLNEFQDSILFPVQVIKIGTGIIGALGGEFFSETGLWLKEKNPGGKYFTIGMANGYVGYVPPLHEIALGGYETWRCRTSYLALNAEHEIRKRLLQLINSHSGFK